MEHLTSSTSPLDPFSVADAIQACDGIQGQVGLYDQPLRVLVSQDRGASYSPVPYNGQSYVAISYCWPSRDAFHRIGISKEPIVIHTPQGTIISAHFSRFVARAVQIYSTSTNTAVAVWMDYHCINQDDTDEKMAQVAILHRIYARATTTLVMLEDVALTAYERSVLVRYKATEETVSLVRRVIAGRWFTRAWCSQELLLSTKAVFFVHDTLDPGNAILIPAETLWHSMDAARNHDNSIPLFNVPRGSVPPSLVSKTTAWALSIVLDLRCTDEYDKISLVCNLVRLTYRFTARPSAFGAAGLSNTTIRLNVLKMANVMAISRRDYSLLLANHGSRNPLRKEIGFGWAGAPGSGDRVSELWVAKDYDVARDSEVAFEGATLVVRGVQAEIMLEYVWEAVRSDDGLRVMVDGYGYSVFTEYAFHHSWRSIREAQALQELMCVLAEVSVRSPSGIALHARIIMGYLLEGPDYQLQPPPILGDLVALLSTAFNEPVGERHHIAKALQFIRRETGALRFSTVQLSEGSVLLLNGNAPQGDLCGRLLFQPFVIRPKLFPLPWS